MKSMLLRGLAPLTENPIPLTYADIPEPRPAAEEVLIRVTACGVCHTELDEIEGRTPPPHLPVVLGHQAVGVIEEGEHKGQRVAWRGSRLRVENVNIASRGRKTCAHNSRPQAATWTAVTPNT